MNSTGGTWQHARMTCPLSPGVSPSRICAASGRPAVPARGGVLAYGRQLRRDGRLPRPERLHAGFQLAVIYQSASASFYADVSFSIT